MKRILLTILPAVALCSSVTLAQNGTATQSAEPFKVGTFGINGEETVGIVLRDRFIVDLEGANEALESARSWPEADMPDDMIELIEDYESGLKGRIYALVTDLVSGDALNNRPDYIHLVGEVDTMAPIPRPRLIMNTAVNFYSHISESAPADVRAERIAARRANRGVPYMFLKATSSVIGNNDTILIPWGRTELDWEIELATVMGSPSRYVPATEALEHIFGYTILLDISDRGGRPQGGFSSGVDWFVMKGQDTFGPMGPWIVPREFYGNPMEQLNQTLIVDGQQMQQANASDMIHSVGEVIEYASSLVTVQPGDIIGTGTSGGVGMGTSVRGEQVWLVAGDQITATIDGIGTLELQVQAAPNPGPGTGAFLPAVE